jgi:hypothetical protein
MKKINTLILFCFLTGLSFAQDGNSSSSKFRLGFKASPNLSWFSSDNGNVTASEKSLQFGYGLNFDIFFTENYAIGTGFNINNMGGTLSYFKKYENGDDIEIGTGTSITGATQIAEITRDITLKYIQIPLTLKLKTNEIGYITYWGQFGLGLNMNMKALSNDEIDYMYYQTNDGSGLSALNVSGRSNESFAKVDIKDDDINIFSSNLILAAGIEYSLSGNTSLLAGFTFQNGFTDVLKSKGIAKEAGNMPSLNGDNTAKTFELSGLPNYVEFNVGILF